MSNYYFVILVFAIALNITGLICESMLLYPYALTLTILSFLLLILGIILWVRFFKRKYQRFPSLAQALDTAYTESERNNSVKPDSFLRELIKAHFGQWIVFCLLFFHALQAGFSLYNQRSWAFQVASEYIHHQPELIKTLEEIQYLGSFVSGHQALMEREILSSMPLEKKAWQGWQSWLNTILWQTSPFKRLST